MTTLKSPPSPAYEERRDERERRRELVLLRYRTEGSLALARTVGDVWRITGQLDRIDEALAHAAGGRS